MNKICLVIMYNNGLNNPPIEEFEKRYGDKFDKIFHLAPLYDGTRDNVIPVFENRNQMSGYVAQSFRKIFSDEYSHYVFLQEDCLLNPEITSYNILETLKLDDDETAFISDSTYAVNLDVMSDKPWAFTSVYNYLNSSNGAQIIDYIPKRIEARNAYKKHGVATPLIYKHLIRFLLKYLILNKPQYDDYNYENHYGNLNIKNLVKAYVEPESKEGLMTIYPFVANEGKMFVIPNKLLKQFAHYCGLFSAVRLHHKVAFAIAMCFVAEKIITPKDLNSKLKVLDFEKEMPNFRLNSIIKNSNYDLDKFINSIKEDTLVAYPVDFNKWTGV